MSYNITQYISFHFIKAEKTIKDVLEHVYNHGFDMKRVDAAIHQTELGKKHVNNNYYRSWLLAN